MFGALVQFVEDEISLETLKWWVTLTNDDGTEHPQAKAGKEILHLYDWWKFTRPKRVDPYISTGFSDMSSKDHIWTPEQTVASAQIDEIEAEYEQEDEEMMIRLIKIRGALWS
jgi:hypothetical protein